ncbi:MAG: hypothetical protein K0Q64_1420 [Nitrobacter vulgaris]|nr:hypothetical protein [Nitrobacter vulgaris]
MARMEDGHIVETAMEARGMEIRFDTQGSVFYGGSETKEISTNHLLLSKLLPASS